MGCRLSGSASSGCSRRLSALPYVFRESLQELHPPFQSLLSCHVQREPLRAIDFRKLLGSAGSWRPLHRKQVALNRRRIAIALEGPGGDKLAAGLADLPERDEFSLRS